MITMPATRHWRLLTLLLVVGTHHAHATQSGGTNVPPTTRQEIASVVDPVRLERAHRRIVRVSATLAREVSLTELVTLVLPLDTPQDQATLPDEHRAALMALAFYVNQWPVEALVQEARTWPRATPRRVTLGGRHDHAQHFIVSAAMAATVGSPLADAVALYKEIRDRQRGSGFSFSDVAANRAGQRFGTLAAGSVTSAYSLATRLRSPLADSDIMPATTDLPDNLGDQEFTRRYGTTGSAAYNQQIDDIDKRVNALAFYR